MQVHDARRDGGQRLAQCPGEPDRAATGVATAGEQVLVPDRDIAAGPPAEQQVMFELGVERTNSTIAAAVPPPIDSVTCRMRGVSRRMASSSGPVARARRVSVKTRYVGTNRMTHAIHWRALSVFALSSAELRLECPASHRQDVATY
ncbi:hypothetical protein [Dactylosporangium cerinum]